MDAAILSRVFHELFSHRVCSRIRYAPRARSSTSARLISSSLSRAEQRGPEYGGSKQEVWHQRSDSLPHEKLAELEKFPMITAAGLKSRRSRPKRVKMLLRDFIEGESLL